MPFINAHCQSSVLARFWWPKPYYKKCHNSLKIQNFVSKLGVLIDSYIKKLFCKKILFPYVKLENWGSFKK